MSVLASDSKAGERPPSPHFELLEMAEQKVKFSYTPDPGDMNWKFTGTFTMTAVFGDLLQFDVTPEDANLYCQDAKIIMKHWRPKPGQVVIDGGCGPGTWTLASLALGARVFALDPKREACDLLIRQLQLNEFRPEAEITVLQCGLWNTVGSVRFNGNALTEDLNHESVPVDFLDRLFDQSALQVDWINLDVEGSELQVLKGSQKVLVRDRPTVIVEVHNPHTFESLEKEFPEGYAFERDGVFLIARGQ